MPNLLASGKIVSMQFLLSPTRDQLSRLWHKEIGFAVHWKL